VLFFYVLLSGNFLLEYPAEMYNSHTRVELMLFFLPAFLKGLFTEYLFPEKETSYPFRIFPTVYQNACYHN
jgi:hypothetical protein